MAALKGLSFDFAGVHPRKRFALCAVGGGPVVAPWHHRQMVGVRIAFRQFRSCILGRMARMASGHHTCERRPPD